MAKKPVVRGQKAPDIGQASPTGSYETPNEIGDRLGRVEEALRQPSFVDELKETVDELKLRIEHSEEKFENLSHAVAEIPAQAKQQSDAETSRIAALQRETERYCSQTAELAARLDRLQLQSDGAGQDDRRLGDLEARLAASEETLHRIDGSFVAMSELARRTAEGTSQLIGLQTKSTADASRIDALETKVTKLADDSSAHDARRHELEKLGVKKELAENKVQLKRAQIGNNFSMVLSGLAVVVFGHNWFNSAQVESRVKSIVGPAEKIIAVADDRLKESLAHIKIQAAEHKAFQLLTLGYHEMAREDNFEYAYQYGVLAERELDKVASQVADFERLRPSVEDAHKSAWILCAECRKKLDDYDGVRVWAGKLLDLERTHPEGNHYMGVALMVIAARNEDLDARRRMRIESTEFLQRAVNVLPHSSKANINLAESHFVLGNFSDSRLFGLQYIDSDPRKRQPPVHLAIATAWVSMSEFALGITPKLAVDDFEKKFLDAKVNWKAFDPKVLEEFVSQLDPQKPEDLPKSLQGHPERVEGLRMFCEYVIKKAKS